MALNAYLKLAPDTMAEMSELSGKVIHLQLKSTPFKCYLIPNHDYVTIDANYIGQVDTLIEGSLFSFARFDGLTITGDSLVAQKLAKIFTTHDIDWEEHFSHYVGDIAAHQLASFIHQLKDYGLRTAERIENNISDYIQEEIRVSPPSEEVSDFIQQVDTLRDDAERLFAKAKLQS